MCLEIPFFFFSFLDLVCVWYLNHVQAMCCSDHIHCCPSNTICDLEHGVCKSGETHVPLLKKISAVPSDSKQLLLINLMYFSWSFKMKLFIPVNLFTSCRFYKVLASIKICVLSFIPVSRVSRQEVSVSWPDHMLPNGQQHIWLLSYAQCE